MPTTIATLEKKIAAIQRELAALGPMRPGNLGMQYRDRKEKLGGFWQISYTHKMRSRSEYVRPEHLEAVKTGTGQFRDIQKLDRPMDRAWPGTLTPQTTGRQAQGKGAEDQENRARVRAWQRDCKRLEK